MRSTNSVNPTRIFTFENQSYTHGMDYTQEVTWTPAYELSHWVI